MKRKKRDERKAEREERSQVERDNQFRRVTMLFFPSFYLKHVKHMYVVV